jgi:PadR family transcriptional regulator, regulatory protein PadR
MNKFSKAGIQSGWKACNSVLAFYLIDKIGCNIKSKMKRTTLGEFEEIVLLITAGLDDQAYAVTITQRIEEQTGRSVGFNTVHTTLQRLEEKGLITSRMGGATAERGGRRKRFFSITALGVRSLREVKEIREKLWEELPAKTLRLARN